MKIIEKTVVDKHAPHDTSVDWLDISGDKPVKKSYINGKWQVISGGGGINAVKYNSDNLPDEIKLEKNNSYELDNLNKSITIDSNNLDGSATVSFDCIDATKVPTFDSTVSWEDGEPDFSPYYHYVITVNGQYASYIKYPRVVEQEILFKKSTSSTYYNREGVHINISLEDLQKQLVEQLGSSVKRIIKQDSSGSHYSNYNGSLWSGDLTEIHELDHIEIRYDSSVLEDNVIVKLHGTAIDPNGKKIILKANEVSFFSYPFETKLVEEIFLNPAEDDQVYTTSLQDLQWASYYDSRWHTIVSSDNPPHIFKDKNYKYISKNSEDVIISFGDSSKNIKWNGLNLPLVDEEDENKVLTVKKVENGETHIEELTIVPELKIATQYYLDFDDTYWVEGNNVKLTVKRVNNTVETYTSQLYHYHDSANNVDAIEVVFQGTDAYPYKFGMWQNSNNSNNLFCASAPSYTDNNDLISISYLKEVEDYNYEWLAAENSMSCKCINLNINNIEGSLSINQRIPTDEEVEFFNDKFYIYYSGGNDVVVSLISIIDIEDDNIPNIVYERDSPIDIKAYYLDTITTNSINEINVISCRYVNIHSAGIAEYKYLVDVDNKKMYIVDVDYGGPIVS